MDIVEEKDSLKRELARRNISASVGISHQQDGTPVLAVYLKRDFNLESVIPKFWHEIKVETRFRGLARTL